VQAAMKAKSPIFRGPVFLRLVILLPAPASRPEVLRTRKQMDYWLRPWRKPDLDKLTRSILDALTGVVLDDDAQIVRLLAEKVYARTGERPGVEVTVEAL
jgi:crossover junction endodeoxyribonuclease RusA